jgi:outer membrane protein assembly factor BamE (lipoprotein component of BamABCDE complex)
MPLSVAGRAGLSAVALLFGLAAASCAPSSLALTSVKTQGYELPADALAQIRPGQSQQLVQIVLGSPQTTNTFAEESAWYYVETKVEQTAFGLTNIKSRTVVAVYFDNNKKVKDKAVYGLQDGKPITIESRRTPSFGEDRTFVESILASFNSAG